MPIRIVVTGLEGQVVRSLADVGLTPELEIIRLGRPQLDLAAPETVEPALKTAEPDIVVNTAAYTAVDEAERNSDLAYVINRDGASAVAKAAQVLGVPVIHLSTDYVFDGKKTAPYIEEDPVAPGSVYGASKLAGEAAVAALGGRHVILRTAWVYAPYGKNFVRTMLALADKRSEVRIVADQYGCPTYAPDIADAIVRIARNILKNPSDPDLYGVFHLAGKGGTTWADFAEAIFNFLAEKGLRTPTLKRITSAEYPTLARRPENSLLNCSKVARIHGIELPCWRDSLRICLGRLTTAF
jgi:dTDP-4-dehydrorhamnose reductase